MHYMASLLENHEIHPLHKRQWRNCRRWMLTVLCQNGAERSRFGLRLPVLMTAGSFESCLPKDSLFLTLSSHHKQFVSHFQSTIAKTIPIGVRMTP